MPLLVCSSFVLSLSALLLSFSLLFALWLSLRHFDRNEDHDNRRNEHADRKKTDRRIGRRDGACLYFAALGRRVKLRGHSEDLK